MNHIFITRPTRRHSLNRKRHTRARAIAARAFVIAVCIALVWICF